MSWGSYTWGSYTWSDTSAKEKWAYLLGREDL